MATQSHGTAPIAIQYITAMASTTRGGSTLACILTADTTAGTSGPLLASMA